MEAVNNRKEAFKSGVREWLTNRTYTTDELYPFPNVQKFVNEMKYTMENSGIEMVGWESFGETLIFAGHWESEGSSIQINVNPLPKDKQGDIRVLFRWNNL